MLFIITVKPFGILNRLIMKNSRSRFLVFASLFSLLFIFFSEACSGGRSGNTDKKSISPVPNVPAPLGYGMKSVEKIYNNGQNHGDDESYCKCRYPFFSGGEEAAAINRTVESWIADSTAIRLGESTGRSGSQSIEVLAEQFLREYAAFRKENGTGLPYQFDLTGSVLLNRSGVLTVDISYSAYTGGAHGMNYTEYMVFDTLSGRRLGISDIFVQGFEKRLNELVDARFRSMKGLSKTDRLDGEQGSLFDNVIRFNQNFALTDKGVTFFYNQYEIAAYAFGSTELQLTYGELADILKPGFKAL